MLFITDKNSILFNVFDTLKNLECNSFMFKIDSQGIHIQSSDIKKFVF